MVLIDPKPASTGVSDGGKSNIYEVLDATTYETSEDQEIVTANDFFLNGNLDLKGDLSLVITKDINNGKSVNVYAVEDGEYYQIEKRQQLISAEDFYLDGDINVSGDWAFITTYNAEEKDNITSFVFSGKYNTELSWQYNSKTNDYFMIVHHGLERHPFIRMMDVTGCELEPKVVHISKNRLMVVSNIKINSQLYVV